MIIATEKVLGEVSQYNEAQVRFHIIDPIIRKLGFADGDDVYFKPEEKLEYPYVHIGRRNKTKDVPLGYPDYRAGLKGRRGCFIIEAKAAQHELTAKDIEQAHSYAAHAQVGANFFALCNGHRFLLYETLSGPNGDPIVDLAVEEIDDRYHEIENVISPTFLEKHCIVQYDKGLKLCDGLGSQVKIIGGAYTMESWSYRLVHAGVDRTEQFKPMLPQLSEMEARMNLVQEQFELRVANGLVNRDQLGRITASVEFAGLTKNNAAAMRLLGIDRIRFETDDKFVSTDVESPSVFESALGFSIEAGSSLPELFGGETVLPTGVEAVAHVQCRLSLNSTEVMGEYIMFCDYHVPAPGLGEVTLESDFSGKFSLELED